MLQNSLLLKKLIMIICEIPFVVLDRVMENYESNSKRPRLDNSDINWNTDDLGNVDFWDKEEITAEEFDMLEIQATQSVLNVTSIQNNDLLRPSTSKDSSSTLHYNVDDVKLQQYALEGQVKLLNDTLNKTISELNIERSNREDVIRQKLSELKNREKHLQMEIEQLKTSLQFQEQETKCIHNKSQALEQKLKLLKNNSGFPCSPNRANIGKFPCRFEFEKSTSKTCETAVQTVIKTTTQNELKLSLLSNKGKPGVSQVVSQLLSNRSNKVDKCCSPTHVPKGYTNSSNWLRSSLLSMAKLNTEQITNELWEIYCNCLQQHILFLRNYNGSVSQNFLKTPKDTLGSNHMSPQHSAAENQIESEHYMILNCLKDIVEILHCQCPTTKSIATRNSTLSQNTFQKVVEVQCNPSQDSHSNLLCVIDEENIDVSESSQFYPVLSSLLKLTIPSLYPDGYCYKVKEIESVLNVLVKLSVQNPSCLEHCIIEPHIYHFVSGQISTKAAHLTLLLLMNLMNTSNFKTSIHLVGNCFVAAVSDLCSVVGESIGSDIKTVLLIEDFLGFAISVHGINVVNGNECQCSEKIVQEFIILLWRLCNSYVSNPHQLQKGALKKGVILLSHLSNYVQNFQEKRCPVEDQYISLMCSLSDLVKDDIDLETLKDYFQDLWDFQEDCGEFSCEDTMDDTC